MSVRKMAAVATLAEHSALVDRLRQPDYTGRNRCLPCAIVNLLIAVFLGGWIGYILLAVTSDPRVAIVGGTGSLAICSAAIYLRGYLVPYTPAITKRYLPDRLLRWFEKSSSGRPIDAADPFDVERFLLESELLEECGHVNDWCLDDAFSDRWHDAMADFDDERARKQAIATLFDIDPDRLELVAFEEATAVRIDDRTIGQWESDAAFLAEVAADRVLPQFVSEWSSLQVGERSRVLHSLRMFLEECPTCHGPVSMGQETIESCCRSFEVVAVTCTACDSRIFEIEAP